MNKTTFILNQSENNVSDSFIDLNARFPYMWKKRPYCDSELLIEYQNATLGRFMGKPSPCFLVTNELEEVTLRWRAQYSKPLLPRHECAFASSGILIKCTF